MRDGKKEEGGETESFFSAGHLSSTCTDQNSWAASIPSPRHVPIIIGRSVQLKEGMEAEVDY